MSCLQSLGRDLWVVDFPFVMAGVRIGTRTTIVRTKEGLVLISPGAFEQAAREEVDELGPVVGLVAPNLMHHLFMGQAQQWWPQAKVWLAPGLEKKRPDLRYDHLLEEEAPTLWMEALDQLFVPGLPKLNETVFFHRSTGTLVLTDLAFNFSHCGHWLTRFFLKLNGALGRFGPTRALKGFFLQDRESFGQAVHRILEWPIEQVVVAHGEVVTTDGRAVVSQGFKGFDSG